MFLTVPALAPDASPVVALVGSVSDKGGNVTSSGSMAAEDGIAPSATLSVDKTLSQETVTVSPLPADENISGCPVSGPEVLGV